MNPLSDVRVRNLTIAVLAVLVLFLAIQSVAAIVGIKEKQDMMPSNVISVRGEGEAIATPDIATFSFTVREDAKDVAAAQQEMATKVNQAIDALKEQGIEEKDIKTEGYYTNPRYQYTEGRQILTGYEVAQTVSVKVRDVNKAGDLLTKIAGLQVGEVSALSFTIDDESNLKMEAKKQAIEKAQAEAEELAEALGVDLKRIVSFYEEYPYDRGFGGTMMEGSADMMKVQNASISPSLPTGEQKITANVSITYEIGN